MFKGRIKHWAALLAVVVTIWSIGSPAPVKHKPGILAPKSPIQISVANPKKWKKGEYLITPLAEFSMRGVVMRSKRYRWDRESELSPIDFVMAWGPSSDTTVFDKIKYSQSGRFYRWRTSDDEIDPNAVARSTANMHMIPANKSIWKKLKKVRPHQIVDLKGYLIAADKPDGWHWASSLTRSDSGAGACEVVWVNEIALR